MVDGTPIDIEKMRSLSVISKRTKTQFAEGREHPDSGRPFKTTVVDDETGSTVTEHSAAGAAPGVSDRQDVDIHPKAHVLKIGVNR